SASTSGDGSNGGEVTRVVLASSLQVHQLAFSSSRKGDLRLGTALCHGSISYREPRAMDFGCGAGCAASTAQVAPGVEPTGSVPSMPPAVAPAATPTQSSLRECRCFVPPAARAE